MWGLESFDDYILQNIKYLIFLQLIFKKIFSSWPGVSLLPRQFHCDRRRRHFHQYESLWKPPDHKIYLDSAEGPKRFYEIFNFCVNILFCSKYFTLI